MDEIFFSIIVTLVIIGGLYALAAWRTERKARQEHKTLPPLQEPVAKTVTSKVSGFDVSLEKRKGGSRPCLIVVVKGPTFLPPPLIIASYNWLVSDAVILDGEDIPALNRFIGREAIGPGLQVDLEMIRNKTQRFQIYRHLISCQLPLSADSDTVREVTNAAVRTAVRLRDLGKSVDLCLQVLLFFCARSRTLRERLQNIRLLLKHYNRNEILVARMLEPLVQSPDFELAFLAAAGLGKNMTEFLFAQAEHAVTASRVAAVREICARRLDGGFDFLVRLYRSTDLIELRREIVAGCRKMADERVGDFLAEALPTCEGELQPFIVEALAARGGKTALAPLYALSADEARPEELRRAAAEAVAKIRQRMGRVEEGMLSNAGETESGGLSLAKDPPGGELSAAREQDPASGEEPE